MDRTKNLAFVKTTWTAFVVLLLAVGCHQEAKEKPKDSVVTAQPTKAAEVAVDDPILAERAKLSAEERKLVDAQEWCAISDERLGSMGAPIKVMVKDRPVFVCCKSCRAETTVDPDRTLAKVDALKAKKLAQGPAK